MLTRPLDRAPHGLRCGRSSATRAQAACPGCFLADVTMYPRRSDSQADTAQKGERAAAHGQRVGTSQQETSPGRRGQDVESERPELRREWRTRGLSPRLRGPADGAIWEKAPSLFLEGVRAPGQP